MYKGVFLIIICILLMGAALGQAGDGSGGQPYLGTANLIPKSPAAAQLMRVNEVTVNLARGVPEISFNLYTASVGNLQIPITLQYDASGIRYDDVPSEVGLKWSLSAGGEISRNINGKPDESEYFANAAKYTLDYIYSYSEATDSGQALLSDYYYNIQDPSQDEYSYSFINKTGYFFYNKNKFWDCNHPFTTRIQPDAFSTLNNFTITDEMGNRSYFGGSAVDLSLPELSGNGFDNPSVPTSGKTSWKLNQITTYTNEVATFTYDSVNSISTYKLTNQAYTLRTNRDVTRPDMYQCNCGSSKLNDSYVLNNYLTYQVSQIHTPKEDIQFYYSVDNTLSLNKKRLDSIVIKNKVNQFLIKKIYLTYDSYGGANLLRLNKVWDVSNPVDSILIGGFHYKDNILTGISGTNRDIFNYNNGFSNPYLISSNQAGFPVGTYGQANRSITDAVSFGNLDSITYPTKGKAAFFYSPNVIGTACGPGAKVDSIVYFNYDNTIIGKETYRYSNPQNAYIFNGYVNNTLFNGDNTLCPYTIFNSEIDQGYPIRTFYYQEVETRNMTSDTSQALLIKEIFADQPLSYTNFNPVLVEKISFRNNSNRDTVQVEKYNYEQTYIDTISADWVKPGRSYLPPETYVMNGLPVSNLTNCNVLYTQVGSYGQIYPRTSQLKSTQTALFSQNNPLSTLADRVSYQYNPYWQKVSESKIESDGTLDSTAFQYLYTTSGVAATTAVNQNLLATISQSTRFTDGNQQLNKQRLHFTLQAGNLILPDSFVMQNLNSPEYVKLTATSYDNNGNILETNTNGMYTSFIRDYNNQEVIANVANCPISQCAYTSFEADGSGNWTIPDLTRNSAAITGKKSYMLSTGNTISKSGLTQSSPFILSYWSQGGTINLSGATISASLTGKTVNGWTYHEHVIIPSAGSISLSAASLLIDELRVYPQSAQMNTYTYEPEIGMTSHCDIRNMVSYYEYDANGRLKVVRDQDGNIIKTQDYHYIQK